MAEEDEIDEAIQTALDGLVQLGIIQSREDYEQHRAEFRQSLIDRPDQLIVFRKLRAIRDQFAATTPKPRGDA